MPDTATPIRAVLRVPSPTYRDVEPYVQSLRSYRDVANDVLRDGLPFEQVAVPVALAAVAVAAALLAFERPDLVTP